MLKIEVNVRTGVAELSACHQLGCRQMEMIMARKAMIARAMLHVERGCLTQGETAVLLSRLGVVMKALFLLLVKCFLQDKLLSWEVLLLFDAFQFLGGLHQGGVQRGGLHLVLSCTCP